MSTIRRDDGFRWEGVERCAYKEATEPFRDVTRQVLFGPDHGVPFELRYFEVGTGGHTTLERHEHPHAVVVVRGRGRVLVGDEVREIAPHDLVHVPPMTWHQFRAAPDAPLGFLCLVSAERDRPVRPTEDDLARLRANPAIAEFLRIE